MRIKQVTAKMKQRALFYGLHSAYNRSLRMSKEAEEVSFMDFINIHQSQRYSKGSAGGYMYSRAADWKGFRGRKIEDWNHERE